MLLKFSQLTGVIPSSLFVEDVSYTGDGRSSAIRGMGSYADVFLGTLAGKSVALKRLRIGYSAKDKDSLKFFRVRICSIAISCEY